MENELKKLAAAMRDMSDMVGDHHWQAAKAIDRLIALSSAEQSKLSADGLEVVKLQHMAVSEYGELRWSIGRGHPKGLAYCELYAMPDFGQAPKLCRLTDAQRLLAQRDVELEAARRTAEYWKAEHLAGNARIAALESQQAASVGGELDLYDAGLLNDFGGGNVDWWQDYIRSELGRAHDFYQSQCAALSPTGGGVVMPDRAEVSVRYGYRSLGYAEGWNDALDEVASLNAKPQATQEPQQ